MPEQPVAAAEPDGRPLAEPPAPSGGRRGPLTVIVRLLTGRVVRWGFVVVAAALCALEIRDQWTAVRSALGHLGVLPVAGALVAVLLGLTAGMQSWRVLLAALGSPLPLRSAAGVVFVGQLGKYVPGSIWPVLAQMELGRAHRVPRRRSATASALTMLLSLAAGLIAALLTLPFLAGGAAARYRWAFLLAPVLLACLHPRVLNPVLNRLLRLARRAPLEQPLTGRAVATALAWALASWIPYGAQVWVLAVRLGASPGRAAVLSVGGFAFAWSVGFLAVFVPAGVGVRDLLLVAVLGTTMRTGDATAIALVSRLLMTAGDLCAAGLAVAFTRPGRRVRGGSGGGDHTGGPDGGDHTGGSSGDHGGGPGGSHGGPGGGSGDASSLATGPGPR
ncbi:lysylphosphatidylglycerol synthase domain-containing protein [Rugosimonospora africana]|uniref:Membrane protein n=1 Tax=Rugosimonospora africana TaxID=556532 RepID=A0A8J3R2B8_9ACTN|nr:lysylphosphatidylglycerol synthase domain-containing protein [Rugosimonospora africana]GIH20971.1 membrane protein [Rugosimonospora africana]